MDIIHEVPGLFQSQTGLNFVAKSTRQFPVDDTHHEPGSSLRSSRTGKPGVLRAGTYHASRNKFERFRGFLELMSRFEFDFRRCGIFFERFEFFGVFKVQSHTMWPCMCLC